MDNKGQGLSTNAIILIILGVFVLAILILGFTLGWTRIAPFISTNNVADIVASCSAACSTNSAFDFCSSKRSLKTDDIELEDVTCNYLVKDQAKYGVGECSLIDCDNIVILSDAGEDNLLDESDCTDNAGKTIQSLENNKLLSFDCPTA